MKLEIGENIYRLRKEKSLTQEQLSKLLLVSTAAVSKWESGISYPDITMLPQLASIFNISIDDLMNYNTKISEEETQSIGNKCSTIFFNDGLKAGLDFCDSYLKKYTKSYKLKFYLANILMMQNYSINNNHENNKLLKKAMDIFENIINNCADNNLVELSLNQLATIEISFNEYDKAIKILEKISPKNLNKNLALSNAYLGKKDNEKARELLEESIILSYGELINSLTLLSNSFKGDNLHLSLKIIDTLEKLRKIVVEKNSKEYNLQKIEIYESFEKTDDSIQCLKELKDYLKETENKNQLNTTPLWFITSEKNKNPKLQFPMLLNYNKALIKTLETDSKFENLRKNVEFIKLLDEIKSL